MTECQSGSQQSDSLSSMFSEAVLAVGNVRRLSLELVQRETNVRESEVQRAIAIERSKVAAVESVVSAHDRSMAILLEKCRLEREKLLRDRTRSMSDLQALRDSEVSRFDAETKRLTEQAKEHVEEGKWLAETMVESIHRKASHDLARLTALSQDALTAIRQDGNPPHANERKQHLESDLPTESDDPEEIAVRLRQELTSALEIGAKLRRTMSSPWMTWIPAAVTPLFIMLVTFGLTALTGEALSRKLLWYGGYLAATSMLGCVLVRVVLLSKFRPLKDSRAHAFERVEHISEVLKRSAKRVFEMRIAGAEARRDSEVSRARARSDAEDALLRGRRRTQADLQQRYKDRIEEESRRWDSAQAQFEETERARRVELENARNVQLADIESRSSDDMRRNGDQASAFRAEILEQWARDASRVNTLSENMRDCVRSEFHPWSDDRAIEASGREVAPVIVPVGEVKIGAISKDIFEKGSILCGSEHTKRWTFPIGLDLRGRGSLLVEHDESSKREAVALLNHTMLRLLGSSPAGKIRLTILDPVALGEQFASFMHLADVEPLIVNDRIWTESKHIDQKLADITEHMEMVIQKYLRNQYSTIQEYNAQADEVAEPYRFLVIADFPAGFSDAAFARLKGIISSGQRCGVYVLMMTDVKRKDPVGKIVAELEKVSCAIRLDASGMRLKDPTWSDGEFVPEAPPAGEGLGRVMNLIAHKLKDSAQVRVPFAAVAPSGDSVWSRSSATELTVELGRAGARRLQSLQFGKGMAQHALIAGRTGSGKSTLFHVMITNLALWYSPDELEFYLIDFKKGVEFKAYASYGLPHARVIAVESEREFGLSVLKRLDAELTERGHAFREAGAQDLASFRRIKPEVRMPRILLAVDEFQEFFVEDDRLSQDAALLLDRLVRQGRAFGMHLVLGSQTLGGAFSIARSTIGQMAVRIALQSSEQDSYLIMSEENTAPRLLTRPGEAIYNDQSGSIAGNSPFQIVWLSEEERERQLQRIAIARDGMQRALPPCIVFEGNLPARLESQEQRWNATASQKSASELEMWLGDAISIKDPTSARMRRRSGGNLLIVGADEQSVGVLQTVGVLSLLRQNPDTVIRALDAAPIGSDQVSPFRAISRSPLPATTFELSDRSGDLLAQVAAEHAARESDPQRARSPFFVFIHGIQRFRDLRKSDEFDFSSDAGKPEKPSEILARLLREGPVLGIHFIVWCDGVNNLERFLNRQVLREFSLRIVYQMSASDSTHVIDSPAAQSLGRSRALLYDDETASTEKFRPFARPSDDRIQALVGDIVHRR